MKEESCVILVLQYMQVDLRNFMKTKGKWDIKYILNWNNKIHDKFSQFMYFNKFL